MRIEHKGVLITDTPYAINITPGAETEADGNVRPFRMADQYWTVEALTEVRDAITEALRQYHLLTATTPTPVHQPEAASAFQVGQVLDGTEDLPIGTRVTDKDCDVWWLGNAGWGIRCDDGDSTLAFIVEHYSPVMIVSLP
jgi:hypothetical protein